MTATKPWKRLQQLILALGMTLLAGCQQLGLSVVNWPTYANFDMTLHKGIAYGDQPHQTLDIYLPGPDVSGFIPVVVFFHGGSWRDGQKEDYRFLGDRLTKHGLAVVIPDYRKFPDVTFPAFMHDAAKAVGWVHRTMKKIDPRVSNLHLMGHSAGAHMGALLAVDPDYLTTEGLAPDAITSFIGLAGPYDFTPEEEPYTTIFGPEETYPRMRATTFVRGTEPPMILLHGSDDDVVNVSNQNRLAEAIRAKGGVVKTRVYDDTDHISIISAFTWLYADSSDIVRDVIQDIQPRANTGSPQAN
ncbi:alpha/beta hydrolase [Coralliovum pocilloporae]|uniref:alpha/beta hydrolase n=1 Tax=Coralliovum pocilloporae TaxID=3066369 RepID=UPI003306D80C